MKTTMSRRITALAATAILGVTGAACSDEDGDGEGADEEIEDIENEAEDVGDEVEEQVDEGAEESDESGE